MHQYQEKRGSKSKFGYKFNLKAQIYYFIVEYYRFCIKVHGHIFPEQFGDLNKRNYHIDR